MVKGAGLLLSLTLAACSAPSPRSEPPPGLVLRGFHLVDVEGRSIVDGDVVIENGVVVAKPPQASSRVIEGHGAFLMPALWDLKASLWGNNSARNWEELDQQASLTRCLDFHLYYGIAHVGAYAMDREWVARELRRADALGQSSAEVLYPDKVICGQPSFACEAAPDLAAARRLLAERARQQVPLLYVSFAGPRVKALAGLSEPLLAEVLKGALARRIPTIVIVDDWEQARTAVELGASVIYGFPGGTMPDVLLTEMQRRGVAWAPPLARYLELDRLLGNERALSEPFLTATLRADVLATYRSPRGLWSEWRPDLELGRARRAEVLPSLARAAKAGVRLLAVSDAGWIAGAFQGYSSHAEQAWLERAGVDGWTRLAAATVVPAALLGRRVGFAPGQAADFVALHGNPAQSAEQLRKIVWVMRKGQLVDRERLLPDLTRDVYRR